MQKKIFKKKFKIKKKMFNFFFNNLLSLKLFFSRFQRLQQPLLERKTVLLKKKEAYQFRRDIEDEKLWISEKLPLTQSTDYGNSLFSVQMLKKKNQVILGALIIIETQRLLLINFCLCVKYC